LDSKKNDARFTWKIKFRVAVAKTTFNKEKALYTSKLGLKFREETNQVLHLEHGFVWCWNLGRSEIG
jgi:hypothetical protein